MSEYIPWPAWLEPQTMERRSIHVQSTHNAVHGRGDQVVEHPGARWAVDMDFPAMDNTTRQRAEAFFEQLAGLANHTRITHFLRATPLGSCALVGVTLRTSAAAFASTLALQGCGAFGALIAGDYVEAGGQLFLVGADAKADAGGNMDVPVRHLVRRALPSLTACVLERASARYALAESSPRFAYTRGITQPPFAASFIEYIPPV